jgi:hypothetical protein
LVISARKTDDYPGDKIKIRGNRQQEERAVHLPALPRLRVGPGPPEKDQA